VALQYCRCGFAVAGEVYRKYLKIEKDSVHIDEAKVESESRFDGKRVLRTNTELHADYIALKYKQLRKSAFCPDTVQGGLRQSLSGSGSGVASYDKASMIFIPKNTTGLAKDIS